MDEGFDVFVSICELSINIELSRDNSFSLPFCAFRESDCVEGLCSSSYVVVECVDLIIVVLVFPALSRARVMHCLLVSDVS